MSPLPGHEGAPVEPTLGYAEELQPDDPPVRVRWFRVALVAAALAGAVLWIAMRVSG